MVAGISSPFMLQDLSLDYNLRNSLKLDRTVELNYDICQSETCLFNRFQPISDGAMRFENYSKLNRSSSGCGSKWIFMPLSKSGRSDFKK